MAPARGCFVVLSFFSINALSSFIESDCFPLQDIFSEVSRFSIDFIPSKSMVFVDFFGLPPAIILEKLVRYLASFLGKLVSLEYNFNILDHLDVSFASSQSPLQWNDYRINLSFGNIFISVIVKFRQLVSSKNCPNYESSRSDSLKTGYKAGQTNLLVSLKSLQSERMFEGRYSSSVGDGQPRIRPYFPQSNL